MTFLNVSVVIVLFFTLLFAIPIRITIDYSDRVRLHVRIAHLFKINLLPKKEKKVRLRSYTERKIAKRERKRLAKEAKAKEKRKLKAAEKKKRKEEKKARKEAERSGALKKSDGSLLDNVKLITSLVEVFFKKFFRHLRIKVARLNVTVATDDAAKTAVLYGAVSQSVSYLIALLDAKTNLKQTKNAQFNVNADFCATRSTLDVCLSFSIRLGQMLRVGLAVLFRFIKHKIKKTESASSGTNTGKNINSNKRNKEGNKYGKRK